MSESAQTAVANFVAMTVSSDAFVDWFVFCPRFKSALKFLPVCGIVERS
jgi:hypothetical protein